MTELLSGRQSFPEEPGHERPVAQAPEHYRQGRMDLYAHLIATFGLDAWSQHAEMECIQYLWRCRKKGDYEGDLRKVLIICQRILDERGCGREGE